MKYMSSPHYKTTEVLALFQHVLLTSGPSPVRAFIVHLLLSCLLVLEAEKIKV